MQLSFEQQLAGKYAALSDKLKEAADFVASKPIDVATRSLRSVSKDANLSPATFSRVSTAVGYASYKDLRDVLRITMERRSNTFSYQTQAPLECVDDGGNDILAQHVMDCSANIHEMVVSADQSMLSECVERLYDARRVLVLGASGSTGIAEYLSYTASFVTDNWSKVSHTDASLASRLVGLAQNDVLIIMTKSPFFSSAINAAREANEAGVFVIVFTDTHTCPALGYASAPFIAPTRNQHFFSSYAATLVLCEILIGMLARRAGEPAKARIADVELRNRRLSEVWAD